MNELVKLLGVDDGSVNVAVRDPVNTKFNACAWAGTDIAAPLNATPQSHKIDLRIWEPPVALHTGPQSIRADNQEVANG